MRQDLKTAAKSENYWSGVATIMPLLGGFVAIAYLGRFSTVLASTIFYLLTGFGCLNNVLVFFLAIYLISVGTGGHKPSLERFGADQFDNDHIAERKKKMSFNWWNFGLCSGLLLGVTTAVYVQDHVSWGAGAVILTAVMAMSLLLFIIERLYYRYRVLPTGSLLMPLFQVLVTATSKRNLAYPSNPDQLYEYLYSNCLIYPNTSDRFLGKAAILEENEIHLRYKVNGGLQVATVTKVEEMKLILNMIPVCATMIVAALVERKRLRAVEKDPIKCSQSLSVLWLVPQFVIVGLGDGFTLVGLQEYFYDQVPDSMRSSGIAFYLSVTGAGNFLSSLMKILVDDITGKQGRSWIGNDINSSRLDKFYWLLAATTTVDLFFYVILARRYSYEHVQKTVADCNDDDEDRSMGYR
ncbi:hypothetical protein Dsin_006140 [Dipteronia sinensis]|uniref:Uncharacterized protein n=1 Tax=Dipteronia sinensis TaxID=43782 RepID=A0AAE0AYN4_9ROSI|nr:hypothetical protein Dsin_006140 [Dipteronia sinensis]